MRKREKLPGLEGDSKYPKFQVVFDFDSTSEKISELCLDSEEPLARDISHYH